MPEMVSLLSTTKRPYAFDVLVLTAPDPAASLIYVCLVTQVSGYALRMPAHPTLHTPIHTTHWIQQQHQLIVNCKQKFSEAYVFSGAWTCCYAARMRPRGQDTHFAWVSESALSYSLYNSHFPWSQISIVGQQVSSQTLLLLPLLLHMVIICCYPFAQDCTSFAWVLYASWFGSATRRFATLQL